MTKLSPPARSKPSNNLAARMGRWSASHWKTAVFGWLAFVIAALVIGNIVGTKQIDMQDANVGQSHRADSMLRDAGLRPDPQTEIVLVQSTTYTANEPTFRAVVNDVVDAVRPSAAIAKLRSPYQPGADQISADRHSAIVEWQMRGDKQLATERIGALTAATSAVARAHPSFYVGEAGSISSGKALNDTFSKQLALAGERSIPLTLAVPATAESASSSGNPAATIAPKTSRATPAGPCRPPVPRARASGRRASSRRRRRARPEQVRWADTRPGRALTTAN